MTTEFAHLLGAIILIPTTGLSSPVLVPPRFLCTVVWDVTLNVSIDELMLRQVLLISVIPKLTIGKLVSGFELTIDPTFPLMFGTHLPGIVLLMTPDLNEQFLFGLAGATTSPTWVNRFALLARPPRAQLTLVRRSTAL